MSECTALATKAELDELRKLIEQKIDKADEERIIKSTTNVVLPLAVAGAIAKLNPGIEKAISASSKALGKATKNAGNIAKNFKGIGKNIAGIAGNAASIAGILADIVAIVLAVKHEFYDLPEIRDRISRNRELIDNNFTLYLRNKQRIFIVERAVELIENDVAANKRQIEINKTTIASNADTIFQNKKQIRINESQNIENALEITRVEREYKQDVERLEQEYKADIARVEAETKTLVAISEAKLNAKIDKETAKINSTIERYQKINETRFNSLNIIIQGLSNNVTAIQNRTQTLQRTKAEQPQLIKIRRRVANVESTVSNKLSTQNFGANSQTFNPEIVAQLEAKFRESDSKSQELDNKITKVGGSAVNQEQLNKFRADLNGDFKQVLAGAGLLSTPILINQINSNTAPSAIATATQQGICNSSTGSGCLNSKIKNPLSQKMDDILTAFNTASNASNVATNLDILRRVTNIQSVVNSSTNGLAAINNFMRQAWKNTKLDKVMNVLNTMLALHNALMLSRNLGQTLGDVASTALQFLNIKDAENNSIDVNEVIGSTVNTWITNLIGAETYANIQTTWISLNRIMVAGQGIVSAVQGVKNAVLESIETVGGWTAKIGNNMMIQGLLEERSFPWMNENINFRNPFGKFMQRLDISEEVLGQVNSLMSSGIEAQENFNQLFEQSSELKTSSQKLQEDLANFDLTKNTTEEAEKLVSESPDVDRLDLIQLEIDEIE